MLESDSHVSASLPSERFQFTRVKQRLGRFAETSFLGFVRLVERKITLPAFRASNKSQRQSVWDSDGDAAK